MTHTIRLYYFPLGLRYATPVIFLFSIFLIYVGYWVAAIIVILIIIFILTAQYITVIDTNNREFIDAFAFYGISVSEERKKFRELDRIVITKGRYEQNINTRSQSRTLRWTDYTATLIYDQGKTLDLVTREDKRDVIQFASLYCVSLGVGIEDMTISSSSRSRA